MGSKRQIVNLGRMAAAGADLARTATKTGELGVAASSVVARRVAIGLAAAADPLHADHGELARMVPEKVEAFTAAGMIMLERQVAIGQRIWAHALNEAAIAGRAGLGVASLTDPAAAMQAQARIATAALERLLSLSVQVGAMSLAIGGAMLAPVHRAASANARRLG